MADLTATAELLVRVLQNGTDIVALTMVDRESILRALEDCPDGLGELRAVLLTEHEGRVRQGLV